MSLRKRFPGYVRPSEVEIAEAWVSGTFVFDANVLLNIHRYSESSSKDLQEVITLLKDRVLIPDQVALEYLKNRADVIADAAQDRLSALEAPISSLKNAIQQLNEHRLGAKRTGFLDDLRKLQEQWRSKLIERGDRCELDVTFIEDLLIRTLPAEEPSASDREEFLRQCRTRFDRELPPGLKDRKKDGAFYWGDAFVPEKFGDVLVWLQILKEFRDGKRSGALVFVTDDQKDDWWHVRAGKILGPRVELTCEACANGVELLWFYTTEHFLKQAKDRLGAKISDETLTEATESVEVTPSPRLTLMVRMKLASWKNQIGYLLKDMKEGQQVDYHPFLSDVLYDSANLRDEIPVELSSPFSRVAWTAAKLRGLPCTLQNLEELGHRIDELEDIVLAADIRRSVMTLSQDSLLRDFPWWR